MFNNFRLFLIISVYFWKNIKLSLIDINLTKIITFFNLNISHILKYYIYI
jgi:hypothetical protein